MAENKRTALILAYQRPADRPGDSDPFLKGLSAAVILMDFRPHLWPYILESWLDAELITDAQDLAIRDFLKITY